MVTPRRVRWFRRTRGDGFWGTPTYAEATEDTDVIQPNAPLADAAQLDAEQRVIGVISLHIPDDKLSARPAAGDRIILDGVRYTVTGVAFTGEQWEVIGERPWR